MTCAAVHASRMMDNSQGSTVLVFIEREVQVHEDTVEA